MTGDRETLTPEVLRRMADEALAADAERVRRQRMRSIALAVALGALVVLFYAATVVRLGGNVINRAL